jgi:hypothetical protein
LKKGSLVVVVVCFLVMAVGDRKSEGERIGVPFRCGFTIGRHRGRKGREGRNDA